jgi:hypothetical protein
MLDRQREGIAIAKMKGKYKGRKEVERPENWNEVMKEYMRTRKQYILDVKNVDLGALVTRHYLEGKKEPAHYMQAGDDFYLIGKANPLGLPGDIPELGRPDQKSKGSFKMRIGIRGSKPFYEIQPEIKILNMPKSPYSVLPGSRNTKKNPFTHQRVRII